MSEAGRVVVFGSINADVVVRASRLPLPGETVTGTSVAWHAGGKGANQAAAAAAAGAATRFIGCVGSDEHGDRLRGCLSAFGVDLSVRTVDGASGQAYITVDSEGENSIVVIAGANASLTASDMADLHLADRDVAVSVLESPVDAVLEFLRAAAPARRILNPTPVERCTAEVLAEADIVVVNEHEEAHLPSLTGDVVVTLGARGARVGEHHLDGYAAGETVDTTGAGDCFVGTLAAHLAAGDDLLAAAAIANLAAARSVTKPGAMESYR